MVCGDSISRRISVRRQVAVVKTEIYPIKWNAGGNAETRLHHFRRYMFYSLHLDTTNRWQSPEIDVENDATRICDVLPGNANDPKILYTRIFVLVEFSKFDRPRNI